MQKKYPPRRPPPKKHSRALHRGLPLRVAPGFRLLLIVSLDGAGVAAGDGVVRDGMGHDTARPDNRIASNGHAGQQNCTAV